jgi:hypothetical protein
MRRLLALAVLLLALQVVLSVVVKLYVTIPLNHPGSSVGGYFGQSQQSLSWALAHSDPWLQVHTAVGLLLVLLGLVILAIAVVTLRASLFFASLVGFVGIAGAAAAVAAYLDFHQSVDLLLMTIGLALAIVAYTGALLITPPGRSRY